MRRKILTIIVLAISATPFLVSAQDADNCPPGSVICNPLSYSTFGELIDNIIAFLSYIAIALAPVLIIYAAFLYLTSEGEPYKIKQAQQLIYYALAGLVIILLSKAIIGIIKGVFS